MNPLKYLAILLLVAGTMALVYGGFTYTSERHDADIGGLHLSIDQKRTVNIPMWAGVGAIVLGGLLLLGVKPR